MNKFIANFKNEIKGTLSGFDRLVLRGSLRNIAYAQGMDKCRTLNNVLLKDFGKFAEKASKRLEEASLAAARQRQRPIEYLRSSKTDKEEMARRIAERDQIEDGLVCVLRCIEPCASFEVYRNRDAKLLELKSRQRKCMHLYHYQRHPVLGWMNARIQTWFPFSIQICVNGREWLSRQLTEAGIGYLKQDNCMVWVEDWEGAQQYLDQQRDTHWPSLLDGIAAQINPALAEILGPWKANYYWSTYQCEWATDVVFGEGDQLRQLYGRMVRHSMTALSCTDVMRYLGRRLRLDGAPPRNFAAEVVMDMKGRPEGVRVKHRVNANSLKAYDKAFTDAGNVLRFEATTLDVGDLKAYRPKEGDTDGPLAWRPMRKGVADLYRLTETSARAVDRYMDALAQVDQTDTVCELVERLGQRRKWHEHTVRALHPFGQDNRLLQAVNRGEFLMQGLRNRDLQNLLFTEPAPSPSEQKRRGAWVSRQLRLLRAHGIIQKVPKTHRYLVSDAGRTILAALFAAWNAKVSQLTALAA